MANTLKFGNGEWAVGKETALAYNDENSNFKPLPFTFDRASTATVVNKDGLIETVGTDEPRIDFLNNTNGHLLLEPSRTNSITYSEDFSQSVWGTWQSTKTLSNNINPKGINGYYEISHTGSSSNNPNTRLTNVSLNGSYTLSFFVKINQSRYISLSIEDYDGDRASVYFDTINKTFTTISNVGSPITNTSYSEFSNDWIRISLSVNLLNAVYNEVGIGIYNPSGSFPSASGEVISVFGSQLEAGSYATSYIPTQGSAVTRLADSCSNGGNEQVINSTEGTLYTEIEGFISTDTVDLNRYITVTNGTSNERVALLLGANPNQLRATVYSNTQSINLSFTTSLTDVKQFNKLAVKYKSGDYALFLNGTKIGSSSETNIFTANTLNDISFDVGGGTQQFRGKVKDLRLYNTALSDSELQALTT
jgi:hypothetical protein